MTSSAELIPAVPLPPFMRAGTLRLDAGWLEFRLIDGSQHLRAPVGELHSVARAVTGIHVWHKDQRYRFALGREGGPTGRARATDMWFGALQPIVGSPPAGVVVSPPWPMWAWVLGCCAAVLGILVVGVGLTLIV